MATMTTSEMLTWLGELFDTDSNSLTLETKKEDIPAWDSLGVVMLMADLDEKFNITISNEELEALDSINAIFKFLMEKDLIETT